MPCFIHFLVGGKPVNSCTRLSHNLATYSQCVCGKEREREREGKRVKGWGVVKVVMNAAVARNIALSSGRWFASTLANLTQSISHLHVVVARLPQKFLHCSSSWSHSDHMRMCVGVCVFEVWHVNAEGRSEAKAKLNSSSCKTISRTIVRSF